MDTGGSLTGIFSVVVPIILAIVLLWVLFRNRSSRSEIDRSERATRELYREEDEAHRGEGDDVP